MNDVYQSVCFHFWRCTWWNLQSAQETMALSALLLLVSLNPFNTIKIISFLIRVRGQLRPLLSFGHFNKQLIKSRVKTFQSFLEWKLFKFFCRLCGTNCKLQPLSQLWWVKQRSLLFTYLVNWQPFTFTVRYVLNWFFFESKTTSGDTWS